MENHLLPAEEDLHLLLLLFHAILSALFELPFHHTGGGFELEEGETTLNVIPFKMRDQQFLIIFTKITLIFTK